jgi:hypothetical protein
MEDHGCKALWYINAYQHLHCSRSLSLSLSLSRSLAHECTHCALEHTRLLLIGNVTTGLVQPSRNEYMRTSAGQTVDVASIPNVPFSLQKSTPMCNNRISDIACGACASRSARLLHTIGVTLFLQTNRCDASRNSERQHGIGRR